MPPMSFMNAHIYSLPSGWLEFPVWGASWCRRWWWRAPCRCSRCWWRPPNGPRDSQSGKDISISITWPWEYPPSSINKKERVHWIKGNYTRGETGGEGRKKKKALSPPAKRANICPEHTKVFLLMFGYEALELYVTSAERWWFYQKLNKTRISTIKRK